MKKTLISSSRPKYKANLHSHSNLSDGYLTPKEMRDAYAAEGIDSYDSSFIVQFFIVDCCSAFLFSAVETVAKVACVGCLVCGGDITTIAFHLVGIFFINAAVELVAADEVATGGYMA